MMNRQKKSSLLTKYSALYEKNPKSRVFAPLAESYRKLGMLEEALKILRDGIKRHPDYVMGYIVLAHCYFDQQNHELAYNTIRPFVTKNLENISLQKLFAQICINLGYLEEALQTFKYLLLVNPKDEYVSEQVKLLEDDLLVEEQERSAASAGPQKSEFVEDEDEWVQVDFNQGPRESEPEESLDEWSMESPEFQKLSRFKDEVEKENIEIVEHNLDDDYYHEEYDNADEERTEDYSPDVSDPIITHTLVDLYIRQGHTDKAVGLLESILELHPDDKASAKKLESLKHPRAKARRVIEEEVEEETDLANLVEEKVKTNREKSLKMLENRLTIFLQKIKKESKFRLEQA